MKLKFEGKTVVAEMNRNSYLQKRKMCTHKIPKPNPTKTTEFPRTATVKQKTSNNKQKPNKPLQVSSHKSHPASVSRSG